MPRQRDPFLLASAGLLAAGGAVALLSPAAAYALVLMAVLTAATAVVVRWPRVAEQALAGLVGILLLPTLLVIALAVRLSSPGPVLIRQEHPGDMASQGMRFRTTSATPTGSGRSTAVGRLLRLLSLDVLPSLLDVVRGDLPLLRPGGSR